jgi:hypothetical protein
MSLYGIGGLGNLANTTSVYYVVCRSRTTPIIYTVPGLATTRYRTPLVLTWQRSPHACHSLTQDCFVCLQVTALPSAGASHNLAEPVRTGMLYPFAHGHPTPSTRLVCAFPNGSTQTRRAKFLAFQLGSVHPQGIHNGVYKLSTRLHATQQVSTPPNAVTHICW